jgi:hypothetical protein
MIRERTDAVGGARRDYARFFVGDFVRNTPGNAQDANWAFAQMTCNF